MSNIKEVKAGTYLVADGGFGCLDANQKVCVRSSKEGLFFNCKEGRHYLNGQVGVGGELIGLKIARGDRRGQ